jgi:hypothetical protein
MIVPLVLHGYETWSLALREEHTFRVFEKTWCLEEYSDPRGLKSQKFGENCTLRSATNFTLHQLLLGSSKPFGRDGQSMKMRRNKCEMFQSFGLKA